MIQGYKNKYNLYVTDYIIYRNYITWLSRKKKKLHEYYENGGWEKGKAKGKLFMHITAGTVQKWWFYILEKVTSKNLHVSEMQNII